MKGKETFASGAPWEEIIGYSRAVRVGNTIEISGTIALDNKGKSLGMGDQASHFHGGSIRTNPSGVTGGN